MKLSDSKIKTFLIFAEMRLCTFKPGLKKSTGRKFLILEETETPKKVLIF